jgi:hypothetical protein
MVCEPTASPEVEKVAVVTPALVATVPVPIKVAPSEKVTVPLGVPEPGALMLTVAVNVTSSPLTEELGLPVTVVVVAAWLTVWAVEPELPAMLLSPP